MSHVLTCVAAFEEKPLSSAHLKEVEDVLSQHEIVPICAPVWLAEEKAVDLGISEKPSAKIIHELQNAFLGDQIDVFINPIDGRRKKLLIADMDSTMVTGETLDDLAETADIGEEVKKITQEAMNGQLDFVAALKKRVRLLQDLPTSALDEALKKIEYSPGARTLVQTMARNGTYCVLVSGGFTYFTQHVANELGFHQHHGNELEIKDNVLTGSVRPPIQDKTSKFDHLHHYVSSAQIKSANALAIGDGANDLPMLKEAGLGIGYRPKQIVRQDIQNVIIHGDLTAALYAQGYTDQDINI